MGGHNFLGGPQFGKLKIHQGAGRSTAWASDFGWSSKGWEVHTWDGSQHQLVTIAEALGGPHLGSQPNTAVHILGGPHYGKTIFWEVHNSEPQKVHNIGRSTIQKVNESGGP